jgi:hypothetical protein
MFYANNQARYVQSASVMRSLFDIDINDAQHQQALVPLMAVASLAPNLATLETTVSDESNDTDFLLNRTDTRRRVIGPKHTLARLTEFTVHFTSTRRGGRTSGINLHKLNGILHTAPNLRSLVIDSARGGTSMTARLPNLTTLRLPKAYLCTRGLKKLTRACTNLVHFEMTYDKEPTVGYLPISPAQVVDCLAPCKATLQRLHLGGYTARQGDYFPLVPTLRDFKALKQVAVDCSAIVRRPDDTTLVQLVGGCRALEGLFLMGLEGFPRDEFACFTNGALNNMLW